MYVVCTQLFITDTFMTYINSYLSTYKLDRMFTQFVELHGLLKRFELSVTQ